ncbi:MAG: outer membrane beta-barrel protein [Yoonia sp.]|nr:outer membrane beta-barrel protein [Yoonia sp.]
MRQFLSALTIIALPATAMAEVELSFYGGLQSALESDVAVSGDSVIPDRTDTLTWEGRSFDAPPYYGWRATYWASPEFGYGLDFAHNKVYPKDDVLPAGYSKLEFTDGLNTLTVNAYRRWENAIAGLTPYVGGGVGLSIPHVEVVSGASETFGYQVTGPAATWIAGASYPISDQWSVFGEYKGNYTQNDADLDTGGSLSTDIITNAVNVGVSFRF